MSVFFRDPSVHLLYLYNINFITFYHIKFCSIYIITGKTINHDIITVPGLLESITWTLYKTGAISYIGLLDWRENWSGHSMLEVRGRSAAHVTLASLFIKLFWESVRPNHKQIVQELNSFDLEHFVSSPKLPPEIAKRLFYNLNTYALLLLSKDGNWMLFYIL